MVEATRVCLAAGAPGITVHPRADARHITLRDVREIAERAGGCVEFNIEGTRAPICSRWPRKSDPISSRSCRCAPAKSPARPDGIRRPARRDARRRSRLKDAGIRVSMFVDPDEAAVRWAAAVGGDRIELYTEPYARAFHAGRGNESFDTYASMATLAHELGLGVNAGHDLDLDNLTLFRDLPHLDEVSIGHALISHALYVGPRSRRPRLPVRRWPGEADLRGCRLSCADLRRQGALLAAISPSCGIGAAEPNSQRVRSEPTTGSRWRRPGASHRRGPVRR